MASPTPQLPRPSAHDPSKPRSRSAQTAVLAGCADALLILLFAAIGRDAHQRGEIITGVFATAWPFLAGAALAWLTLRLWRDPLRVWPAGVGVWLGAVAGGMILRAVTGQTVVLAFIIVALLSLGIFLVGYRLAAAGVRRLRSRRRQA
jgi:peptidoglycan/LPS O-acetylase OafA/YrhL